MFFFNTKTQGLKDSQRKKKKEKERKGEFYINNEGDLNHHT